MFNLINSNTWMGFASLYGILLVAGLSVYLLRKQLNCGTQIELKSRIKTWLFIITGMMAGLSFNRYVSIAIFCIISFYAFYEYISAIGVRPHDRLVVGFTYAMIPLQYYWIAVGWSQMSLLFIPVYVFLSIPLFLIISGQTGGFLRSMGVIYWGFMASVFCVSHVAMLFVLNQDKAGYNGASLIFFLLFLTGMNDVLQYLWGKTFGKIKILPVISPNKTLAGLLGGVLSTTALAVFIAPYFTPFTLLQSVGAGLIVGLGGFVGDICMSAIKRDLGIKDYSDFLPGHGGILDRLDSLIYTAPLFFHYLCYLHH